MTTVSTAGPARRKRGRPRKDGNLSRESSLQSLETPCLDRTPAVYPTLESIRRTKEFDQNLREEGVDCIVGSMVYGVIEGSFDAGYFISVRIGNQGVPYRGAVFQPRKTAPLTAANDIAPQARMYERQQVPVPGFADSNQSKQPVFRPAPAPFRSPAAPGSHSELLCSDLGQKVVDTQQTLKMVEEDEVMQAFEVSSPLKWPYPSSEQQINHRDGEEEGGVTKNPFFAPSPNNPHVKSVDCTPDSPNLDLDLSSAVKAPSIGYQQALVTGNPLLLPSDSDLVADPQQISLGLQCGIGGRHENGEAQQGYEIDLTISQPAAVGSSGGGGGVDGMEMEMDRGGGAGCSYTGTGSLQI